MLHGAGRNVYCWEMLASRLLKVIMVIHKYYYFDCNGSGMESIESEGTHAVGKCPRYNFIKI